MQRISKAKTKNRYEITKDKHNRNDVKKMDIIFEKLEK
jgi:hypothetical protein